MAENGEIMRHYNSESLANSYPRKGGCNAGLHSSRVDVQTAAKGGSSGLGVAGVNGGYLVVLTVRATAKGGFTSGCGTGVNATVPATLFEATVHNP